MVSVGLHGLFLATVALLPPPTPAQLAAAPAEMAFLEVEPPEPAPEPPPEPVAPEPAPAASPSRAHRARPHAPPAPVATASDSEGGFAVDRGEEGGVPGGTPGGSGEGIGDGAGTASEVAVQPAPAPTGPSRAELRRRVRTYIRGLSDSLAGRVGYPLAARRAHLEGVVVLRVRLAVDGTVLGVRLARSSGHSMLDDAALASLQGVDSLAAPPDGVPWDERRELPVPIRFRIQ